MRNPISNAVKPINRRDLRTCNRCGCPDLAWVQFKSGKWSLVQTAGERPLWRGDGPAPEGLYALKFNSHRCEEYLQSKAEAELRAQVAIDPSLMGGKNVGDFLAAVTGHIVAAFIHEGGNLATAKADDPVINALRLVGEAASRTSKGV